MIQRSSLVLAGFWLLACGEAGSAPPTPSTAGSSSGGVAGSATAGAGGASGSAGAATDASGAGGAAQAGAAGGGTGTGGASGASAGQGGSGAGQGGAGGMAAVELELKAMSFNLRYGTADDGDNAWALRQDLTFDVFTRQDADVIGIQEGLDQQLKDIDAAVSGYARLGVGRNDGKTKGEYSAIYYRSSRFDVEASGTFWFSDTPEVIGSMTWGNELPRICTWAHFIDKATGYGFYHFNVHLDAYVQAAREKSVVLLMQRVVARPVATDPAIVTGDFNAGEDNLASRYMRGAGAIEGQESPLPLVDSFRVLFPNETEVLTAHGFKGGTKGAKIDYVYLLPGTTALAAEIDRTHDGVRYPSDHYPVAATLRFPPKQ